MSDFYLTDTIELISVTEDPTYGTRTTNSTVIACRHEAKNKLITNSQGQDIRTHTNIFMADSVSVKVGDEFKILTKNGKPYRNPDQVFQVKVIFDNVCFGDGILEINA